MYKEMRVNQYVYGVGLPLALTAVILIADVAEGTKDTYIGILAVVPPISAIFGTVRMVLAVSIVAWLVVLLDGALGLGGDETVEFIRLVVMALVILLSVFAAQIRIRNERRMLVALAKMTTTNEERKHAKTDYLTGCLNRFGFMQGLETLDTDVVTLAIFDFDKFKVVNDVYGHQVGDEYIKDVSLRISGNLKADDIFGRWGGDEFVAVFKSPHDEVRKVVQRIIDASTTDPVNFNKYKIPAKFSVGLAVWNRTETFESVFIKADQALYEAKSRGGCQAVSYEELPNSKEYYEHAH